MREEQPQNSATNSLITQYQALLAVSESITAHRDLAALFRDLAQQLQAVVRFDFVTLILHDPARNVIRRHILAPAQLSVIQLGRELPVEESAGGWVWQTQQPLLSPDVARDNRFPQVLTSLRDDGVQSCCWLPLTTAQRRLGAISFGSKHEGTYSDADVEFMQRVADQVAVAVDNVLHTQEAKATRQQLTHERDRLQLLLEVNNAVVMHLDIRELFQVISSCLRQTLEIDYVSLALFDEDTQQLRLQVLDFPAGHGMIRENIVLAPDTSPSGLTFKARKPMLFGSKDLEHLAVVASEQYRGTSGSGLLREGIHSFSGLPLLSRQRSLGVLGVGRYRDDGFSDGDVDLLSQVASQIAIAIDNALAYRRIAELNAKLAEEKLYLEDEIRSEHNFEEIVGESPALRRVLQQVEIVAPTDSAVLIQGETGTGKELIARALHNLSGRRERTFVKLNCAAIPTGLLESELFGHERGAFTGAIAQKIGRFELAHKGTLFLDEVGDIPLELQPKLLRVLQEQEFERLGSTRTLRVDVRLLAATNHDLAQMAADKQFRSDLYYRFNVFPLTVPPLRERADDIPLLVRYFAQKYARRMHKRIETIPAETMATLSHYHWPGNIRELQNVIERAVILSRGSTLQVPLSELQSPAEMVGGNGTTLETAEREHILRMLEETQWVVGGPSGAAARLGMKRTTLQSRMRKLGIMRPR
jgi:formate hydrogenlyase transcriptional activator